jgi:hypothetical protein
MALTRLEELIDEIRCSGEGLEEKRKHVFRLIEQYADEDPRPVYRLAQDILFPTAESRAVGFAQFLNIGNEAFRVDATTYAATLRGVVSALCFGEDALRPISEAAANEILLWRQCLEAWAEDMPGFLKPPPQHCAHCGQACGSTYAMMDDWVLCLTSSGGRPSCFTRVNDQGEPLGSANTIGQN